MRSPAGVEEANKNDSASNSRRACVVAASSVPLLACLRHPCDIRLTTDTDTDQGPAQVGPASMKGALPMEYETIQIPGPVWGPSFCRASMEPSATAGGPSPPKWGESPAATGAPAHEQPRAPERHASSRRTDTSASRATSRAPLRSPPARRPAAHAGTPAARPRRHRTRDRAPRHDSLPHALQWGRFSSESENPL